jgi:peptidoglycan/xylan/chitin deacetylase (PgdA/CDA1 family)
MAAALIGFLRWLGMVLYGLRLHPPIMWLNRHAPKILLYHACEDSESDFTRGLNSNTTPSQFAAHLRFLQRHYRIIPLAQLQAGRPPCYSVVLTFDDGYRSVFTHAWPLLRSLGAPATLYVVTDVIGNEALVWVNELNWFLRRFPDLARPHAARIFGLPDETTAERLLEFACTRCHPGKIELLLQSLRAAAKADPGELAKAARLYLTWEEIREMVRHGISCENHTATHANLERLSEGEQTTEIARAHEALAKNLGTPCSFAFPFGFCTEAAERSAAELGYSTVMGVGGVNRPVAARHLGRVPVRAASDAALFAELEVIAPIKGLCRRLIGKSQA